MGRLQKILGPHDQSTSYQGESIKDQSDSRHEGTTQYQRGLEANRMSRVPKHVHIRMGEKYKSFFNTMKKGKILWNVQSQPTFEKNKEYLSNPQILSKPIPILFYLAASNSTLTAVWYEPLPPLDLQYSTLICSPTL